jgi:hypothetical protein
MERGMNRQRISSSFPKHTQDTASGARNQKFFGIGKQEKSGKKVTTKRNIKITMRTQSNF